MLIQNCVTYETPYCAITIFKKEEFTTLISKTNQLMKYHRNLFQDVKLGSIMNFLGFAAQKKFMVINVFTKTLGFLKA